MIRLSGSAKLRCALSDGVPGSRFGLRPPRRRFGCLAFSSAFALGTGDNPAGRRENLDALLPKRKKLLARGHHMYAGNCLTLTKTLTDVRDIIGWRWT